MENITLRLEAETIEELEVEADEHGVSRSEYIRNLIATRNEHDAIREEYEERIEELEKEVQRKEARITELRNQMTARENMEEKVDVLAKRVEEQESAMNAPFLIRWIRWWRGRRDGEEAMHG